MNDDFKKMDLDFGEEKKPSEKLPEINPTNPAHTQEMVLPKDPTSILDKKNDDNEITLEGSINHTVEVQQPVVQQNNFATTETVKESESNTPKTINTIELDNEKSIDETKLNSELNSEIEKNKLENNKDANEFSMNDRLTAKSYEPTMDKTLEFIIQNDPSAKVDLQKDIKVDAKKKEKFARRRRLISHLWVVICVLSIMFGISSIWTFAEDVKTVIDQMQNDEGWILSMLNAILHSAEALLFIFFIVFSMIKYSLNHKIWIKWWDETEPQRVTKWIAEEKNINVKLLQRVNALGLYYTHVNKESKSDHELLSNLREENKTLNDMIKKEEQRKKEAAKASKK